MTTITLIGLGPGDPTLLTRMAWEALEYAPVVYTPLVRHAALAQRIPETVCLLPPGDSATQVAVLIAHADQHGQAVCALPGHPGDHTLFKAVQALQSADYTVCVIPGISLIDTICELPGIAQHRSSIQVITADDLLSSALPAAGASPAWCEVQQVATYTPPPTPYPLVATRPALIWCDSSVMSDQTHLQTALLHVYPATHMLQCVQPDNKGTVQAWSVALSALHTLTSPVSAIYLPPLQAHTSLRTADGLHWIVARLLGPDGCPWDREQTHRSLRANLLEEVYEVLEALDTEDMPALAEESGDLLVQVFIHSEMARQAGHFNLGDVIEQIGRKLIRRHPHIFGNLTVDGSGQVLHNWEQIKAQELAEKGRTRNSALDGIPVDLPALATAQKLVSKAGRSGFEWRSIQDVWHKLYEELDELVQAAAHSSTHQSAEHQANVAEELGDLLFVTVSLARWLHLDAESVLRAANHKFRQRFTLVEAQARQQQRDLHSMTPDELETLWQQAKQ